MVGRRMKATRFGTPKWGIRQFYYDFADPDPTKAARKAFRRWFGITVFIGGFSFAHYTTSTRQMLNTWYNRPDLKPFPAMVPMKEESITEKTAKKAHYHYYRKQYNQEEKKRTAWYRLFFPLAADYTVKRNPYVDYDAEDIYDPRNGFFSTTT
jgi:hypothetical protein